MKKGDAEKINKRKDKLAESRKELQDALDELDKVSTGGGRALVRGVALEAARPHIGFFR